MPGPAIETEREIRFAVVMYGGVSLAIYINGVAQELLSLARATAPKEVETSEPLLGQSDDDKEELAGTAGIYRKLGQYLADSNSESDWSWIDEPDSKDDPIRTRFVIDVISGTSAGGINGVFLAKALARTQRMNGLKKLWLSEGDLAKLLNDSFSVEDLADAGYTVQEPRQSLLNSQRMYRKLLDALADMDESNDQGSVYDPNRKESVSPLVDELDLFVTTTDIEGLPLPIALADRVVFERRYKNVFHFRYAGTDLQEDRDDFGAKDDPFLAFAARCTSSFPFAFEPMRLRHINEVLESYPRYAAAAAEEDLNRKNWDRFFSEYLRPSLFDLDKEARGQGPTGKADDDTRLREAFQTRSFGDGGYLDNKPFSYATATLMRRPDDFDVERKLIYIEPSPEHPELLRPNPELPDFAENVRAAVLDLPREETIREDLDRLNERNRILERVTTYGREVDADLTFLSKEEPPQNFESVGLGEMMGFYGIGYGAYHRLKVAEITSFLAEVITRQKGHDPDSDAGTAFRELVAAWRRDKYTAMSRTEQQNLPSLTENRFLSDFDVRYRMRRVIFLSRRISDLLRLDPARPGALDKRTRRLLSASLNRIAEVGIYDSIRESVQKWLASDTDSASDSDTENRDNDRILIWRRAFVRELRRIKRRALARALIEARSAEEILLGSGSSFTPGSPIEAELLSNLKKAILSLQVPWSEMKKILQEQGASRSAAADALFADWRGTVDEIVELIRQFLATRKLDLDDAIDPAKKPSTEPPVSLPSSSKWDNRILILCRGHGERVARLCVAGYDENFVRYDLVTYPLEYGTGVGEANKVDVYRVSPEDAVELFDERKTGREKLAGRALMSFGAFLDRGWRKNDMLWGRLDGAERLICALLPLPGPSHDELEPIKAKRSRRSALIKQAHVAIFNEEFRTGDIKAACDLIGSTLGRCEPSSEEERKLRAAVEAAIASQDVPAAMRSALFLCLDKPGKIWDYYRDDFNVNRELEAETALRLISRATNITGKMLEGLANKYGSVRGKRGAVWIARLGSVFWNTIGVAVPQSLPNLFFRHWLGLLYVFSTVLIFAGIIFTSAGNLGWKFLGVTVALHLVTSLLGDFMAGSGRRLLAARIFGLGLVVLVVGCGGYFLAQKLGDFVRVNELAVGAVVAGVVLVARGASDWRAALRTFRAEPHGSFNTATLGWLTLITVALAILLKLIGPPGIAQLEFAYSPGALDLGGLDSVKPKLYLQLGIDYVFLISYAILLASYCIAAAKIFWTRLESLERRARNDSPGDRPNNILFRIRALNWLITVGFILAGLQCLAAAADATENTGLLFFIRDHQNESGLPVAYYCAWLKFILVSLGALYSAAGFVVGVWSQPRRWSLWGFALVGVVFVALCWLPLWCVPLGHCAPPCSPFLKTSTRCVNQ